VRLMLILRYYGYRVQASVIATSGAEHTLHLPHHGPRYNPLEDRLEKTSCLVSPHCSSSSRRPSSAAS
jgi:hypothetical protein